MDFLDAELISEFVIESQEGLANVESQMLAIEAAGEDMDLELVNAVFRTMHSIKGTAGFIGLDTIGRLAHSLEEVLNSLRNREVMPSSELVSSVLHAADFITELINAVETSNEANVDPFVAELQQFRPGGAGHAVPQAGEDNPHIDPDQAHRAPEKPGEEQPDDVAEAAASGTGVPAPTINDAAVTTESQTESSATAENVGVPGEPGTGARDIDTREFGENHAVLSDVVRDFLQESRKNLDALPCAGETSEADEASLISEARLWNCFRCVQSVKVGAHFHGFSRLEALAESCERTLAWLRSGSLTPCAEVTTALRSAVQACRTGLDAIAVHGDDGTFEGGPVIDRLLSLKPALPEAAAPSKEGSRGTVKGSRCTVKGSRRDGFGIARVSRGDGWTERSIRCGSRPSANGRNEGDFGIGERYRGMHNGCACGRSCGISARRGARAPKNGNRRGDQEPPVGVLGRKSDYRDEGSAQGRGGR